MDDFTAAAINSMQTTTALVGGEQESVRRNLFLGLNNTP